MKRCIAVISIVIIISCIFSSFMYQSQAVGLSSITGNPDGYKQENGDNSGAIAIGNIIVSVVRGVRRSYCCSYAFDYRY